MKKAKIKSVLIQLLMAVLVFTSIVMIDQHNRALAKTPTKNNESVVGAGMSKALRDMLENPVKVKIKSKKKKAKKPKINEDDLWWLAHAIDGEFRGQTEEGKWLVGACILNRVKSDLYPNTLEGVIKDKKYDIQYKCYWDGNFDREPEDSSWNVARDLLENGLGDFPKDVVYQSFAKQGSSYCEYVCTSGRICYFCHNKWMAD